MDRRRMMVLVGRSAESIYDLYDDYSVPIAAGSINATMATDGVNIRTVIDSAGTKMVIANGLLTATPTGSGDPRIYYPPTSRELGKLLHISMRDDVLDGNQVFGFSAATTLNGESALATASSQRFRSGGSPFVELYPIHDVTLFADVWIALRSVGCAMIISYGYKNKLILIKHTGNTATLYPMSGPNSTGRVSLDFVKLYKTKWFPSPDVSDSFNRADGVIGNTDGLGHAEGVALYGSGGSGYSWSNEVGAFAISTNKAKAAATAISVVEMGSENNYITCYPTRAGGVIGIVARYVDINNYIYLIHDGTNVVLGKLVGGVDTAVQTTAKAYSATAEMILACDGTDFYIHYNDALIGTPQKIKDAILQESKKIGMITTDAGNAIENFVGYRRYQDIPSFAVRASPLVINAPTFLSTPTYDSSNQAVHPGIYYNEAKWNGHKYWLAMTPYPASNDTYENPSILVSHDGDSWYPPAGVTNPLIPYAGSGNNADTDLLVDPTETTMYIFYLWGNGTTQSDLNVIKSTDGVNWSAPATLLTAGPLTYISPSVIYDGSQYRMWYNTLNTTPNVNVMSMRTCATPDGVYSAPTDCTFTNMPAGYEIWHLTVIKDGSGYRGYFVLRTGKIGDYSVVYVANSSDGLTWIFENIVKIPVGPVGSWDANRIYRCAVIKKTTGYDVWYSAKSGGGIWRIGRTFDNG